MIILKQLHDGFIITVPQEHNLIVRLSVAQDNRTIQIMDISLLTTSGVFYKKNCQISTAVPPLSI